MRKLKFHEKKLLKKTDFFDWKDEKIGRENAILSKYHIQKRDDYKAYNRMALTIQKLTERLRKLPETDEFRIRLTTSLLTKLRQIGILENGNTLAECENLSASRFCRRRLAVVLVKMRMAKNAEHASDLISHGHITVGGDLVTDPARHVTVEMEDMISWANGSSMKRHIDEFRNVVDDFELANI